MNQPIDPYLDSQYDNRAAVKNHQRYFDIWRQDSEIAREAIHFDCDIPYHNHSRTLLDIARPEKPATGIFLFIHGGYWQAMDKSFFSFMANKICKDNETLVLINYGLCPDVPLSEIIIHCRLALIWVWKNRSKLAEPQARLTLCGHSAGGHLIADLLTSPWSELLPDSIDDFIKHAISISGLFDLQPLVKTRVNTALSLDIEKAKTLSPIFRQPNISCSMDLIVGEMESEQYHYQSQNLDSVWRGGPVETRLIVLPEQHHFSIINPALNIY